MLAGGDAAEHASGMVAKEALGADLIAMLGALLFDTSETDANLDALDGIDAHQRMGDIGVQTVKMGSPKPGGSPSAMTVTSAPMELPSLRNASM